MYQILISGISKKSDKANNEFIKLKLLNVEERSNNLILSHRRALIAQASSNLIVGNIIEGIINQITPYGLFIKVGNLKGLVHISEINIKQLDQISSQFKIGDTIKAVIIHVDKKQGRLSLSMKHLK